MMRKLGSSVGLTPRIAMLIVLTLAATQCLNRLFIEVAPQVSILFYTRDWLADRTALAVRQALDVAPARRAEVVSQLNSDWLEFSIQPDLPRSIETIPAGLEELRQAVTERLGSPAARVTIQAQPMDDPDWATTSIAVVLADLPAVRVHVFADDFQQPIIIASQFHILVDLRDGTWLRVSKPYGKQAGVLRLRNVGLLFGGLILIASISIIAARTMIRPLRELALAADRLGREREPTSVAHTGVSEIDAIGRSLNEMQRRLKRFVDDRTQMLAAISHDLRTPLTRLRLFAESVPDEMQRRQVLADVAEMDSMIKASLAFATDEIRREVHSRVDIAALLISLCDVMSDTGEQASYEGPDHAELPCQPIAIRRAFTNLIDNACKYGRRAQVVLRDTSQAIEVTIADSGPGIPAHQIELAFEPFQRLDSSRNRESGGVGLGLTIARDVIRGHGGEILLEANAPMGLLVRVILPKPGEAQRSGPT